MWRKCKGFLISTSNLLNPQMSACMLWSSCEIREVFQMHFGDRFARLPNLQLQEFRSSFADFPHFLEVETDGCEGLVTECEVHDELKQVGLNKSPSLDGLSYEVYLRMLHMFVPILKDVFNHWFAQGAIPTSITKGVITLLKKEGTHVWERLDDYRSIILQNIELKILTQILANRLQTVVGDLIGLCSGSRLCNVLGHLTGSNVRPKLELWLTG